MKELQLSADGGIWRVAFTFDPKRNAILLVAGDPLAQAAACHCGSARVYEDGQPGQR